MVKTLEQQIEKRYPDCTLDHYDIEGDTIDIYLTSHVKSGTCPVCNKESSSTHAPYTKKFADLPIANMFCTVHLSMRTLICRSTSASSTFFPARHVFLSDPRAKKTDRLVAKILEIASQNTVRGTVEVCKKAHIKCDKNTVSRLLKAKGARKCDLKG